MELPTIVYLSEGLVTLNEFQTEPGSNHWAGFVKIRRQQWKIKLKKSTMK